MSGADRGSEAAANALPAPPGLALEGAGADEGALVLSFPIARTPALPPVLTTAEQRVVECLLLGLSNAEIAHERGRSPRTVANQIAAVFAKLGVNSRLELALSVHRQAAALRDGVAA